MKRTFAFRTCRGLGSPNPALRPAYDPDSGEYQVALAVNLDVDAKGGLARRPGFRRIGDGDPHSLWADGENLYAVRGGDLLTLGRDGGRTVLRSGLEPGAAMAFLRVDDRVFYANGRDKGVLREGVCQAWGEAAFPGPDPAGVYAGVPAGELLEYHAGRIFLTEGGLVRFTGGVGLFDWVDEAGGFLPPLDGRIRMLRSVGDGLYLGGEDFVLFAAGTDPESLVYRRVLSLGPVPGSDAVLEGEGLGGSGRIGGVEVRGRAVLWTCRDGIYLGLAGGRVEKLKDLDLPATGPGSAVCDGRRYLCLVGA